MSKPKKDAEVSFEEGLSQLEAIVTEMESGELSLENLIVQYEEGTQLLKKCDAKIKEAELKIQILKKKEANSEFDDFDPDRES